MQCSAVLVSNINNPTSTHRDVSNPTTSDTILNILSLTPLKLLVDPSLQMWASPLRLD
jgi:hypothetical protein